MIDYTIGYFFLSVRGELRPIFNEALEKANIGIGHEFKNLFYYLPKEDALKFNTAYVFHLEFSRSKFYRNSIGFSITILIISLFEGETMSICDQLRSSKISKKSIHNGHFVVQPVLSIFNSMPNTM